MEPSKRRLRRWRGVGAPTRGTWVGWGRGPWRAAGRGPARPQLREHIGLKASRVVLERVTIAGFQYFLAGSDPGRRVRMAAPTGRDGVSFYTLVPGEGGWDSCLPVATRRPSARPRGDGGEPASGVRGNRVLGRRRLFVRGRRGGNGGYFPNAAPWIPRVAARSGALGRGLHTAA